LKKPNLANHATSSHQHGRLSKRDWRRKTPSAWRFLKIELLAVLVAVILIASIGKLEAVNGIPRVGHEGHTTYCFEDLLLK